MCNNCKELKNIPKILKDAWTLDTRYLNSDPHIPKISIPTGWRGLLDLKDVNMSINGVNSELLGMPDKIKPRYIGREFNLNNSLIPKE